MVVDPGGVAERVEGFSDGEDEGEALGLREWFDVDEQVEALLSGVAAV